MIDLTELQRIAEERLRGGNPAPAKPSEQEPTRPYPLQDKAQSYPLSK